MPKVAVVRLRYVPKDYWFSPAGIACEEGDHVLVETARGREIGVLTEDLRDVDDKDIKQPLKPVLRIATEEDFARAEEMNRKGEKAMVVFKRMVEKHGLDMKPARVEFMFDGDFATFYFAAEERVDFRALVRDLASEFHVRVDMRQIGARDEARMLGGLGHCGEELCCCRMGGEFQPVSIRMAKEQDLPLNPSKISGLCGRLMCCLRYEFEAYKDFKGRAPKKNALIDTPMGMAKVVEFDTLRERIRLRMEDGSTMTVPLSSMDTGCKQPKDGEKLRPCHIGPEAFDKIIEELHHDANLAMMGEKLFSEDGELADKVASRGQISRGSDSGRHHKIAMGSEDIGSRPGQGDSRRRRERGGSRHQEPQGRDSRRRRRSVSVDGPSEDAPKTERRPRRRGGNAATGAENAQGQQRRKASAVQKGEGQAASKPKSSNNGRRRRRGGASRAEKGGQQPGKQQEQRNRGNAGVAPKQQSKPRPGQKSSTLHGDASAGTSGDKQRPRRRRRRGSRGGSGGGQGQNNNSGATGGND